MKPHSGRYMYRTRAERIEMSETFVRRASDKPRWFDTSEKCK